MLQKEFEERLGRSVSEEEYVEANAMYELAGDGVDKDVFCRAWAQFFPVAKRRGTEPDGDVWKLLQGLYETAYRLSCKDRETIINNLTK